MTPSTTVALRVCHDGNDGELSNGGTARASGGPHCELVAVQVLTAAASALGGMSSIGRKVARGHDDDGPARTRRDRAGRRAWE